MRISDWSSDVCSSDLIKSWRGIRNRPVGSFPSRSDNANRPSEYRGSGHRLSSGISSPNRHGRPRRSLPLRVILVASDPHPINVRAPCALRFTSYRSEEHTSELQSLMRISYAVFCLKKNNIQIHTYTYI